MNQDYYRESNSRYIYGRKQDSLESVHTQMIRRTSESRSRKVNDGWQMMQSKSQQISKVRATRDAELQRVLAANVRDLVEKAKSNSREHTSEDSL